MKTGSKPGLKCVRLVALWGWLAVGPLSGQEPVEEAAAAVDPVTAASERAKSMEESAQLLAIVGKDPVLMADVKPRVEQILKQMVGNQQVPEEELAKAREMLTRKVLAEYINMKVVYRGFIESVAGSQTPEKAREAEQQIRAKARKYFYEQEVSKQLADRKLSDINALDRELRKNGSSLEHLERQFIEAMAGSMYVREQVPKDPPVTPVEQQDYYQEHLKEFDMPARARWEQLTILFSRVESRDEAFAQIAAMGNEALFGGNLQAVAKRQSHDIFAEKGGVHEWTRRGSLKSKVLDQAIFSLPLNKLSEIIEDDQGFHIVRVLEREEARRKPFSEVQDEIKEKLQDEKREAMHERMVKKIRATVPVWSAFPDDYPGALPLAQVADASMLGGTERR